MARTLVVEVAITVQNDEQAAKIFEAVANGMAETAIKERVLFGVQPSLASSSQSTSVASAAKTAESAKELTPLTHAPTKGAVKRVEEKKPERSRGIMGRTKLGRTGGNR